MQGEVPPSPPRQTQLLDALTKPLHTKVMSSIVYTHTGHCMSFNVCIYPNASLLFSVCYSDTIIACAYKLFLKITLVWSGWVRVYINPCPLWITFNMFHYHNAIPNCSKHISCLKLFLSIKKLLSYLWQWHNNGNVIGPFDRFPRFEQEEVGGVMAIKQLIGKLNIEQWEDKTSVWRMHLSIISIEQVYFNDNVFVIRIMMDIIISNFGAKNTWHGYNSLQPTISIMP